MAFSYTTNTRQIIGGRLASGTYSNNGGSTGGVIDTGLPNVSSFLLTATGSGVTSNQSVYSTTLPAGNGKITIVTNANESGSWLAVCD